jgi:Protein of unknown function (DUF1579)
MYRPRQLVLVCMAALAVASFGRGQALPRPGPELARLKQFVGTWDASAKIGGQEAKGTMTWKMDLGGLWLISDYEGEMLGQKLQGKGMDTYDPIKKKYIGVWADSMSTSPMISEGSFDADGKTLTSIGDGPGADGKPTKYKSIARFKDKDTILFTLSSPDKDGKDEVIAEFRYARKK